MKEESQSGVVTCQVSIRMVLLQRQTLTKTRKLPLNRYRPSFSSLPRGIWQVKCPLPQEFSIESKKIANDARGSTFGGGGLGVGYGCTWN